ncbi:MAG TPA: alpha/beta hydrolase, partial [Acidimicrobiales bacterium]|nr:alpha/beta hydrolase [Acidimicrobiales bacterium]
MPTRRRAGRLSFAALAATGGLVAADRTGRRRWEAADDPTDGRPLDLPPGSERAVPTPDGTLLAVWEMGDPARPPIVLGHGWTADRRVWAAVARRLVAAGQRVVAFDQRGHGHSTVGRSGYTVVALADDLRAVLEGLDARDAVVAGHSMGGMAAQAFAVGHKEVLAERVKHLVLVSTAARRPLYGGPGSRYERLAIASTTWPALARGMADPHVGPWLVRLTFGAHPALCALRATAESVVATPVETRRGFLTDMAALDLTADLPALDVPTTVVWGTRDALTLPSLVAEVADLIPRARSVVLHGLGHQLV